jgi:hypothetical protein
LAGSLKSNKNNIIAIIGEENKDFVSILDQKPQFFHGMHQQYELNIFWIPKKYMCIPNSPTYPWVKLVGG